MTEDDAAELVERLTILAEVLGEPMSATRLAGYVAILSNVSMDDLIPALNMSAKMCKFFPKPIDILDGVHIVRAERETERVRLLIARTPAPPARDPEVISDEQWRERISTIKTIMDRIPMKPHVPLRGPCYCADCQRQRGNHVAV